MKEGSTPTTTDPRAPELVAIEAENDRLQFLLEAKAALSESIDLDGCLDRLAKVSIPQLADGISVHLLDEDGRPELVWLDHRDPAQTQLIRDLIDRFPVRLDDPGIGTTLRQGSSGWIPEISDAALAKAAHSPEHFEMLKAVAITSGLAVPLVGPDGVFGAVTFITGGGRHLTTADIQLIEQLVSRASVLLRNAQLMEAREIDRKASRYQAALLQTMVEAGVDGILAVSPDGEVLWHNQRFLQLWHLEPEVVDQGDEAILVATAQRVLDPDGYLATIRAAYHQRPVHHHDEVELADERVLDRHGSSLFDPDGEYLGFLWSFRDVTLDRARTQAIAEAGERSAVLARTLQQSLLPPQLPRIAGVDLAARYHAAGEGLEVGGDFYDVFPVGDDWMLVVGDVCGTGAEAATITALARYTIRAAANHDYDPAAAIAELNKVMVTDTDFSSGHSRFATVCCIRLRVVPEGLAVDVACGGHPPPVLIRADGTTEEVGVAGTLVGVFPEVELTTVHTVIAPGDTLVAYTDGVIEARDDDGRQFDVEGIYDVLGPLAGRPAHELVDALEAAVLRIQGGISHDDIAVLVAQATTEASH